MGHITDEVVRLKLAGHTWNEIGRQFPDLKKETLRSKWRRWKAQLGDPLKPDGDQVKTEHRANTATVTAKGRICTLDGLLEAAEVDLEVWKVRNTA
jgi:hypothetical protein